jgi:hypothetical protein
VTAGIVIVRVAWTIVAYVVTVSTIVVIESEYLIQASHGVSQ